MTAISFAILFGEGYGIEYVYFLLIVIAFYLYRQFRNRLFFAGLNTLLYIFQRLYNTYFENLIEIPVHPYSKDISFFFALIATFLLIQLFAKENDKYERQSEDLLAELKTKNEALKAAYTELERFTYIASHDLKTPLRTIVSFLGLTNRSLIKNDVEGAKEYLEYAKSGAKQMHFLVSDILEYSRINQDESQQDQEEIDLNILVDNICGQLTSLIEESNATLTKDELPNIKGNRVQMQLLFQNLIENGIKYNKSETPRVEIRYQKQKDSHLFEFKDNGIGIHPDFQQSIFEMFKRLHTNEAYQGTGIGLAICKKIVDACSGEIWLESEEGTGSSFFLMFPLVVLKEEKQENIVSINN